VILASNYKINLEKLPLSGAFGSQVAFPGHKNAWAHGILIQEALLIYAAFLHVNKTYMFPAYLL